MTHDTVPMGKPSTSVSQERSPVQDVVEAVEDLGKGLSRLLLRGSTVDERTRKDFFSTRVPEMAVEAMRLLCICMPLSVQSQVWDDLSPLVVSLASTVVIIAVL